MKTDKFIRRAQHFIGDSGTVDQAVVIQKRPPSAIAGGVGAFLAVAVILGFLGITNFFVVGLLGGGALGGVLAWLTKNYYLVGVEDEVQMIELATWSGRPETLVKTLPRPLDATLSKGLLVKSVMIDGEKYVLSKMFEAELGSLSTT